MCIHPVQCNESMMVQNRRLCKLSETHGPHVRSTVPVIPGQQHDLCICLGPGTQTQIGGSVPVRLGCNQSKCPVFEQSQQFYWFASLAIARFLAQGARRNARQRLVFNAGQMPALPTSISSPGWLGCGMVALHVHTYMYCTVLRTCQLAT
jgi:hypothetical protein